MNACWVSSNEVSVWVLSLYVMCVLRRRPFLSGAKQRFGDTLWAR